MKMRNTFVIINPISNIRVCAICSETLVACFVARLRRSWVTFAWNRRLKTRAPTFNKTIPKQVCTNWLYNSYPTYLLTLCSLKYYCNKLQHPIEDTTPTWRYSGHFVTPACWQATFIGYARWIGMYLDKVRVISVSSATQRIYM